MYLQPDTHEIDQPYLGIALSVIGVGLAIRGLQISDFLASQLNEVVTGSPTDEVMTMDRFDL